MTLRDKKNCKDLGEFLHFKQMGKFSRLFQLPLVTDIMMLFEVIFFIYSNAFLLYWPFAFQKVKKKEALEQWRSWHTCITGNMF